MTQKQGQSEADIARISCLLSAPLKMNLNIERHVRREKTARTKIVANQCPIYFVAVIGCLINSSINSVGTAPSC